MQLNELLKDNVFFGFFLSLVFYYGAERLQKRFPYTILNPLLLSSAAIIFVLSVLNVDFDTFEYGAKYLSYLLTPVTICLAIPMYKQIQVLKKNLAAVMIGLISGCLAGAASILVLALIFRVEPEIFHSLQPKSVTTAIAIGISNEIGGIEPVTILAVMFTGLFGAMILKPVCKIVGIVHPVALGLACGNSAHAIGTSKALEMGEIEGAMSSLSIVVAGTLTVILSSVFSGFIG